MREDVVLCREDGIANVVVVVFGNVGRGGAGVLEEVVARESRDEYATEVVACAFGFALGLGRIGWSNLTGAICAVGRGMDLTL